MVPKWTNGRGTPPVRWLQQHFSRKTSRTSDTATFFVFLTLFHPFCIFSFFVAEKLQPLYIEMAPKRTPKPCSNLPMTFQESPWSTQGAPGSTQELPGSPQGPPRSTSELPTTFQEPPGSAQELPSNHQTTKPVVFAVVLLCFMFLCIMFIRVFSF